MMPYPWDEMFWPWWAAIIPMAIVISIIITMIRKTFRYWLWRRRLRIVRASMNQYGLLTFEVIDWANKVFPARTAKSALLKLFEEVGELVRDPTQPGEYGDILIMLIDLAAMHEVDLIEAGLNKMRINRGRHWAMGPLGTLQHLEVKHIGEDQDV